MHILVTGFEPFGGDAENASQAAVGLVAARWRGPATLTTASLPVDFDAAPARLRALVEAVRPDAVLCVGEAGGRTDITPERGGRNWMDARIPDNAGHQPRGVRIDAGPPLRVGGLDPEDMVARMRGAGLPAHVSEDAGAFVCNRVAYEVGALRVPGGFVHVPAVRSAGAPGVGAETDAGVPVVSGLSLDHLATALAACVSSAAQTAATYSSPR